MRNEDQVYVGPSKIAGQGIFAKLAFEIDAPVIILTGPRISGPGPMELGPNWVGIDKEEWIDPLYPVVYLNHSCDPNAAFGEGLLLRALRPIAQGEEITMDYSATEADLTWRMECRCGVPACRKMLTSIQTAFAGATQPPPATRALQEIWRQYQEEAGMPARQSPSVSKAASELISLD